MNGYILKIFSVFNPVQSARVVQGIFKVQKFKVSNRACANDPVRPRTLNG